MMKTIKPLAICFTAVAITACTTGTRSNQGDQGTDSPFVDSVARDSATWGDTSKTMSTPKSTDSLASPSFP